MWTKTFGLLRRLRRNVAGNTLAIMAAAMIPLAAFSGSAIDMARIYVVKVRLQQACDAGALAGRKFMNDDGNSTLDANAESQAETFFADNFKSGWFSTEDVSFTPVKTDDNQVAGTASATVPMTLMRMFGSEDVTLNVSCQARYDVADADIMFVLDTTGSMACPTSNPGCSTSVQSYTRPDGTTGYYDQEQSGSKISGLRSAVLSFYDTLAANVDPATHIRYGFVPYTSTANVGYLLPQSDLVSKWNYQTRVLLGDANGGTSTKTYKNISKAECDAYNSPRSPSTGYDSSGQATVVTTDYSSSTSWRGTTYTCTVTTQTLVPKWRYEQAQQDVSQYITGASVTDPTKVTGATSKWQGCIEERDTTVSSSFNVNNLPYDLDPDLAPTSDATKWRPMWPDVIYYRGSNMTSLDTTSNLSSVADANYVKNGYVSCGKPAQRLTTMTRSDVSNYVNASDFRAIGGTYHDTGMIWGTRLISPKGIFASDTAAWPGHQDPNRYIVFMTDGEMAPNDQIYGMYGMEYYDKRVTGGSYGSDTDYHNARFVAECDAAKARNITVFVVGFGQALNQQLTDCASPGKAYYASDNASLTAAFQKIANQVAMLRLSK